MTSETEAREALPAGLTLSEDGSLLNWRGENYVIQRPPLPAPSDDERAALADALFQVYAHGTSPNAFREADALIALMAEQGFGFRRPPVPADTPSGGEVLVEGSWFKRADLPEVLGNFMRSSAEHAREAKDLLVTLTELRPVREADTLALASRPTPPEDVAMRQVQYDDGSWSRELEPVSTPSEDVADGESDLGRRLSAVGALQDRWHGDEEPTAWVVAPLAVVEEQAALAARPLPEGSDR